MVYVGVDETVYFRCFFGHGTFLARINCLKAQAHKKTVEKMLWVLLRGGWIAQKTSRVGAVKLEMKELLIFD